MKSFANALLDSSAAAAADGPTIDRSLAAKTIHDAAAERNFRTDDGQIDLLALRDGERDRPGLPRSAGTQRATAAMPGLPGAQTISVTSRSRDSFHANACSRAPPPTTRIFMRTPDN